MNYTLNRTTEYQQKTSIKTALTKLWPLMSDQKGNLLIALLAILTTSGFNLLGPIIIGYVIDTYVRTKDFHGVLLYSGILLGLYLVSFVANYIQTKTMGTIGQRVLFKLRNAIFSKLQELPVAFFNQNKAGDLISRINSDTDKLNQFFSQALMQFVGNIFIVLGAAIFILSLKINLGVAALLPAVGILIITQMLSAWIKRRNAKSLQTLGGMSAEIQESINNFKAIVAFNRSDYFRERFAESNQQNYKASISSGIANNIFAPLYTFASNLALLITMGYGIVLIIHGQFVVGLLISFILYVNNFYSPLRQLASIWSTLQLALAAFDRISEILELKTNMEVLPESDGLVGALSHASASASAHALVDLSAQGDDSSLMQFKNVYFSYPDGKDVLHDINFSLEKGKTYALVGPTGGGKTTTASLMARLYDPTEGQILLSGKDIRSYQPAERTQKIGFILQEPFLFTGTVRDNILYSNEKYQNHSNEELEKIIAEDNLTSLLERFESGLETKVTSSGDSISLGQKQLIAFMRAVLRHPELLILDEATANIDTVTEQLLTSILEKLPKSTTRVIIAHRLNTIEGADEIFFINAGTVTKAGSFEHALEMLLSGKRES
jgi:ATP-binding cassette subfamily B protein